MAAEAVTGRTFEIIKWTIGIVAPVVSALSLAVVMLWRKNNSLAAELKKKDDTGDAEIKRLNIVINTQQAEQIAKYYEVLKELVPYFEKNVEIQSEVYDGIQEIVDIIKRIDIKHDGGHELKNMVVKLIELVSELHKWHSAEREPGVKVWWVPKNLVEKIDAITMQLSELVKKGE